MSDEHPATHIDPGPVNPWNPTPEQFAGYKAREVELAKANIRRIRRDWKHSPDRLRTMTLHSASTLFIATQAVLAEDATIARGFIQSIHVTATFTESRHESRAHL
jgi:hypothetical protein